MEEEEYLNYCTRNKTNISTCIICTEEFKSNDKVSGLRCSEKHCFHTECIKNWIDHKLKCPLCRANLDPDHLSETSSRVTEVSI